MLGGLLMVLLLLTSVFLILLVLVQRGRGGGLAGAFGGMGGQSAFGTKAGDLFTRITIFVAAFWIILCAVSVKYYSGGTDSLLDSGLGKERQADDWHWLVDDAGVEYDCARQGRAGDSTRRHRASCRSTGNVGPCRSDARPGR